jgi:hypothetical protein
MHAWQLVNQQPRIELLDHAFGSPLFQPAAQSPGSCYLPQEGPVPTADGSAGIPASGYEPLGAGDLLTLARLAPILPVIENAAAAYDVPVHLLLRVLLNESYLDPLAEGPTGDLGLSQVTSDALTLLAAVSGDPRSELFNPLLITTDSNVFEPGFSACAGAAKLAWALRQPGVTGERQAYALYINPLHGFVNGVIGDRWLPLTAMLEQLSPAVDRLLGVHALHAQDPLALQPVERKLVGISAGVRSDALTLGQAYRETLGVVVEAGIADTELYERVLTRLYPEVTLQAGAGPG